MSNGLSIKPGPVLAYFDSAMAAAFESYFFQDIRPCEGFEPPVTDEGWIRVDIDFQGPVCGRLHLVLSRATAFALTGSLPLADAQVDEPLVADLLAEITNAVSGRIASALAGPDFAFDLTIPEVRFAIDLSQLTFEHDSFRAYESDFGFVILSLSRLRKSQSTYSRGA